MQLNGKTVRGVRNARSFWTAILAVLFGIVFIGLGAYFIISPDQGRTYETATAQVLSVESEWIADEDTKYVMVKYEDKDGVEHSNIRLDAYVIGWGVGSEIEIKYNVADFSDIKLASNSMLVPILCIGMGGLALAVGVYSFISTRKRARRQSSEGKGEKESSSRPAQSEQSYSPAESLPSQKMVNTDLFFHYAGKLNQSYAVEDKLGNIVFECKLAKFSLLGASTFDFIDSKSGLSVQHKIGKTVTSSSSGGLPVVGDITSSGFKIDGTNCWDYISDMGYSIKHMLQGKAIFRYEIMKNGEKVASVVPASVKDPFNKESMNYLRMAKGNYRLEIVDAELKDIVMMAFVISKTDIVE